MNLGDKILSILAGTYYQLFRVAFHYLVQFGDKILSILAGAYYLINLLYFYSVDKIPVAKRREPINSYNLLHIIISFKIVSKKKLPFIYICYREVVGDVEASPLEPIKCNYCIDKGGNSI